VERDQRRHQQPAVSKEIAMEILDRYLQAVRKHLPAKRQNDIIAELKANLESQIDEREAELGRPMTADEAAAWVKQLGPPIQMAAPYGPQMYLIGPGLFPTYWYVLKLACSWAAIIYVIVSGIELMSGNQSGDAAVGALFHLPWVLMMTAAWVTLIFAAIEICTRQSAEKYPALAGCGLDWSPTSLPQVEAAVKGLGKKRTFATAVAEVVFGFLVLIWILLVPAHPWVMFGPGAAYLGASPFRLGHVWWPFYWWAVANHALLLGWNTVALWQGQWQAKSMAQRIVTGIVGLIPLVVLLAANGHGYVFLRHPETDAARYGDTLSTINLWTWRAALIIFLIAACQLAWELGRMGVKAGREAGGVAPPEA
jgi:hypothetical protein